MSHSKPRITLAMAFAILGATPAFAWPQNGPEWLRMMEKVRADKADPGSPRTERVKAEHRGSFTAHAPDSSRGRAIMRAQ